MRQARKVDKEQGKMKKEKKKTSTQRCPICKFKIRGRSHEQGSHHQKALRKLKSV